jgi:methionyl-tRNA formyltransferase
MKNKILFLGYGENQISDFLMDNGNRIISQDKKMSLKEIKEINPNQIISYGYRHIIPSNVIENYPKIINLHVAYLPWNKGYDPNFWSWLENTPKGYTIHYINEGIDTGDILVQEQMRFNENETLKSSYGKLKRGIENLFILNWDNLLNMKKEPQKQIPGEGNHHYSWDLKPYKFLMEEKAWDTPVKKLQEYGRINDLWREK